MNKENLTELFSFKTEILDDGNVKIPAEKLLELKNKGFVEVTIAVFGESKTAAGNTGIDPVLFENIKKMQGLPDDIVLDFLKTKGGIPALNSRLKEFDNK
jgi:hypothetical protein